MGSFPHAGELAHNGNSLCLIQRPDFAAMKRFTQLFKAIDATTSTNAKVAALGNYFQEESPRNAVWALYLLLGKTRRDRKSVV